MNDRPLVIKKRGDDGTRIISVRVKEETLNAIDDISRKTNHSRNELINLFLKYGIENTQIKE